jgi:hypothetical protein
MRKFLVLTMTAALVVLMGSSAQATIRDITDPSGDVVKVSDGDPEDIFEPVSRAEGDIVFTRIQHTATAMVVYMRFRQLTVPKQYAAYEFTIIGNNGRGVDAAINTRHGDPQGVSYASEKATDRDCAHSNHINYAGDSVWMRIARRCLKNPKYISVWAQSDQTRTSRTGSAPTDYYRTTYYDVPTRGASNTYGFDAPSTPWVVTG